MAAFSIATDLAMGQAVEQAMCSTVLALRVAGAIGADDDVARDTFYYGLLRYIGCNSETAILASIAGDELLLRRGFATVDPENNFQVARFLLRTIAKGHAGESPLAIARAVARGMVSAGAMKETFDAHCEVAQRLARRLGFGPPLVAGLGQLYERWDGRGLPQGLRGEAVAPFVRIVNFAQDMFAFYKLGGAESAEAVARERSGGAYDPHIVTAFCGLGATVFGGLDETPSWKAVLASEPTPWRLVDTKLFDEVCRCFADFADVKSTFFLSHSRAVAAAAASGARALGLSAERQRHVYLAGLLHDVGRAGVSSTIWEKPTAPTETEWERIRLHAYYTERVCARAPALSELGTTASMHHERQNGAGYHRSLRAATIPVEARLLAAADAFAAMMEPRPHRPARGVDHAAAELHSMACRGELDDAVVAAILVGAGARSPQDKASSRLTAREIEILMLVARGRSTKDVGTLLHISGKTADNHIQHIYQKIGVRTRAAAAVYAMENGFFNRDVL